MSAPQPAYIVSPLRSPVGKAFRGSLSQLRPDDLCAQVIQAVLRHAGPFDPAEIDDVIIGCAMPEAEQGMNVARFALLLAGLPDKVPGVTVNRFCSSGLQTIAMAADRVRLSEADCVVAGGTESMTLVPMMGHKVVGSRAIMDEMPEAYLSMGLTAENVADDYEISREDQDAFALESHQKAVNAQQGGLFGDEICSIEVTRRHLSPPDPGGEPWRGAQPQVTTKTFDQDEGPRADTSLQALARLKPAFRQDGSVTAGNSSQMSDGAAACLVCSEAFVKRHNLRPLALFRGFAAAGVPPRVMGIGPIAAIPKVLERAGIQLADIERLELNEAFAAQALAVVRQLAIDPQIVNPTGGAIALGHPLGATGAKLAASLIHGMHRDQQRFGIVSMCIGTGMGAAGLFERT